MPRVQCPSASMRCTMQSVGVAPSVILELVSSEGYVRVTALSQDASTSYCYRQPSEGRRCIACDPRLAPRERGPAAATSLGHSRLSDQRPRNLNYSSSGRRSGVRRQS